MKQVTRPLMLLMVVMAASVLLPRATAQDYSIPANIQKAIASDNYLPKQYQVPASVQITMKKNNIDPAAVAINFSVVSCKTPYLGRVKIEGKIKNIGANNFVSSAGQAMVILYESIPGGTTRAVATRSFTNLATQAELAVSFVKEWDKSAEFPPKYKLMIVYDPDIYLDALTTNDDMNTGNNVMEKDGSLVNKMKFPCK